MLFDDPGLGKTCQALTAIGTRAIVVCPASAKAVWRDEALSVRPDLSVSVLTGTKSFRWPQDHELVILNPEILPTLKFDMPKPPPGVNLISDEAQAYKNPASARSNKFRALSSMCETTWMLTGTPLMNKPPDLYGITRACHMDDIWGGWGRFMWLFRAYETRWGPRWGRPREEVADIMRANFLGRSREEALPDLPTKTYTKIKVDTDRVKDAEAVGIEEKFTKAVGASPNGEVARIRADLALAKAVSPHVRELLRTWEDEAPLVVFSYHTEAAHQVASLFGTKAIHGAMSALERETRVKSFRDGGHNVIVGTIGAMGVALTLTRAWRVVFLDRSWSPAENTQAEDRICRIGQKSAVQVIDLVSADNSLDDHVFRLLKQKARVICESVDAARSSV
jgi:SWI/SNF-related matrix-associated actin-dependent regulator 1 of chromatin subfamily A